MPEEQLRISKKINSLDQRYGIFRAAKFGVAGAVGFLVAEIIIIAGLYAIYGKQTVSGEIYSSPTLLGLNIVAFVVGVTVGFFINERITVRNIGDQKSRGFAKVGIRLLKFQGVYAVGNAITIGIQLGLLKLISLPPAIGNIIGAIVAFPVSYFFSMRVVWRLTGKKASSPQTERSDTSGSRTTSESGDL